MGFCFGVLVGLCFRESVVVWVVSGYGFWLTLYIFELLIMDEN